MLNTNWSVLDWNEMARLRQPLGMLPSVFQMHFINPNFLKVFNLYWTAIRETWKDSITERVFGRLGGILKICFNILKLLVKNYLYSANVEVSMDLVEPLSLLLGS